MIVTKDFAKIIKKRPDLKGAFDIGANRAFPKIKDAADSLLFEKE